MLASRQYGFVERYRWAEFYVLVWHLYSCETQVDVVVYVDAAMTDMPPSIVSPACNPSTAQSQQPSRALRM